MAIFVTGKGEEDVVKMVVIKGALVGLGGGDLIGVVSKIKKKN